MNGHACGGKDKAAWRIAQEVCRRCDEKCGLDIVIISDQPSGNVIPIPKEKTSVLTDGVSKMCVSLRNNPMLGVPSRIL
ncbi:MAG: hypothetical protein WCN98_15610 [Verrucomicrobiaceae bacterium]